MGGNRHGICGSPPPSAKRRKKYGDQPRFHDIQPKPAPGVNGDSMRVPLQRWGPLPSGSASESSVLSFPSYQSTHPSAANRDRHSSLTSGTTTRLESERALSNNTPSTPTGTSNGDFSEHGANTMQIELQSPNNGDIWLGGINDPSFYPWGYNFGSWCCGVNLAESPDESSCAWEWNQRDPSRYISSAETPRKNHPCGPWDANHLDQCVQGNIAGLVEEGRVLEEAYDLTSLGLYPVVSIEQQINTAHRSRIEQQNRFTTPVLQHQPSTNVSWSYQEQVSVEEWTPSYTSSSSSESPISVTPEKIKKRGGRTRGLSESGRNNARERRKEGSCFSCFYAKERCVMETDGCKRCQLLLHKRRIWQPPCSLIGLDQRSGYMSPDALTMKLKGDRIGAFLKDNIRGSRDFKPFKISLTLGFGTAFQFDAIEVFPRGEETIRMFGFGVDENGSTVPIEMVSPPILPYLLNRKSITKNAERWVDLVIQEADSDFLEGCFPEPDQMWEKEMLTIICRYYRDHLVDLEPNGEGPYRTLQWALKMAALNHIMSQPLVIPRDEVTTLSGQLRFYKITDNAEWVCPRLTNRIIKNMLLPMLQDAAQRVLHDLSSSKLLRALGGNDLIWDQTFCIVFLCLVVVGKTQKALAESAELAVLKNDESLSFENAKTLIFDIEDELSMHLIGMFHCRFGTTKKGTGGGQPFNPLARDACDRPKFDSKLAEEVRWATANHGTFMREMKQVDLEQLDLRKMEKENVRRLLAKFFQQFLLKGPSTST